MFWSLIGVSNHGPGTQIHVTPDSMLFSCENNFISFHSNIQIHKSRQFSNTLVEMSERCITVKCRNLSCRPQMLSDDILSIWIGGS